MKIDYIKEFDRQIEIFIQKKYPEAAGMSTADFVKQLEPLKKKLESINFDLNIQKGKMPFIIVIKNESIPAEKMMDMVVREGNKGFVNMTPSKPTDYKPIETVQIPQGMAYLLIDIDRGVETLNVRPNDAFTIITKQNRTPLTIDEGIAIIIQYPDFIMKNNCYSLLASRTENKQVPALWLTNGMIRLGWCWEGNPHTWLGSASCGRRVG